MNTQPVLREPFLAASHLFGAGVALLGILLLSVQCGGNLGKTIVIGVYGFSLVSLFLASGLLHGLHCSEENEVFLEKLDYMAIYFFIAGTYTPLCMYILDKTWGNSILFLQWLMAGTGIYCTIKWGFARKGIQIGVFLIMGWMFLLTVGQISAVLSSRGLEFLVAGGLFYSIGAFIFAFAPSHICRKRIDTHAIWHIFVLLGATSHYLMIAEFMAL